MLGSIGWLIAKSEPKRMVTVTPVVLEEVVSEVEEERREAEPGTEHQTGRDVAGPRPVHARAAP